MAPAAGTHEPLPPIEHDHRGAVSSRVLCRVGLDLTAAVAAPHDQAHAGRGGGPARRRGAPSRRGEGDDSVARTRASHYTPTSGVRVDDAEARFGRYPCVARDSALPPPPTRLYSTESTLP